MRKKIFLVSWCFLFLCLFFLIHAQVGSDYFELVGSWPYGASHDIAIDSARNLAFIGNGSNFEVIDVSNPLNPRKINEVLFTPGGVVSGITLSGNYAYVAQTSGGMRIINVSNPRHLKEMGVCDTPEVARSVEISGNYAFVTDHFHGLRVIDVSNPRSPSEVGSCAIPGITRGIVIYGNFAYLTTRIFEGDGAQALRIIDISDPLNPYQRSFFDVSGTTGWADISVDGNYVFVPGWGAGLTIVNVSDPDNPLQAYFYDGAPYMNGLGVSGNHVFLPTNGTLDADDPLLVVLDITDPNNPVEEVIYPWMPRRANGLLEVAGNYLYMNFWLDSLSIFDISDFSSIVELGSYEGIKGLFTEVDVSGDYACLINYKNYSGCFLKVLDVSDPVEINELGSVQAPSYIEGMAVSGDYAYLATYRNGLRVIDISVPSNPTEISVYADADRAYNVTVSGNYAFVANHRKGLEIVDISNPLSPSFVGRWNYPGDPKSAQGIAVSGDCAFLAESGGTGNPLAGLRILDISEPSDPFEVGSYEFPGYGYRVAVLGDYAYLVDLYEALRIVDVSDPADPTEINSIDLL